MKKTSFYIFMLAVICYGVFGCATAEDSTRDVARRTYNAIEEADAWIQKNMW